MSKYKYFDGHNDVLCNLMEAKERPSFFDHTLENNIDYERAKKAGFIGGLFAVFVDEEPLFEKRYAKVDIEDETSRFASLPPAIDRNHAMTATNYMVRILLETAAESAGKFGVLKRYSDLDNFIKNDKMAAVLHFEGADAIAPSLDNLYVYHAAGLRSLGITWSRPNIFGNGVPFAHPANPDTGPGLTEMGKRLVKTCNDIGIMVDLAHLNAKGFWDVAGLTDKPLVCSHSSAHKICPSSRALTDQQLDAIGESNGVFGMNFHVNDIRPDGKSVKDTPISVIIDHIKYISDRIGVEHVGIGSDFDGARISNEIGDVTGIVKLFSQLEDAGFSESEIELISHKNWLRVIKDTWKE